MPGEQEIRIGGYRTTVQLEPGETAEMNLEIGGSASPAPAAAR